MKKLLFIFTITIITFLNLNSWNSLNDSYTNTRLDPAWVLNDLMSDVSNNPAQLNNLKKRFFYLGTGLNEDNPITAFYAKEFNKFRLGVVASSTTTNDFDDSNKYLRLGFSLAKNDYGISYVFRSGDSQHKSSSEIDNSIEAIDNDEPVTDITNESSKSKNDYSSHTIKIGRLKNLGSGKILDFVSSFGISLNNSETNSSTEEYQNYDPDEDGDFGQGAYHNGYIIEKLTQHQTKIEAEYSELYLSASTRMLDNKKSKKTKSLSLGLGFSSIISDDYEGTTYDSLHTTTSFSDSLIIENSHYEYLWEKRTKLKFNGFIGKGSSWEIGTKGEIILSSLLSGQYLYSKLTAVNKDIKQTVEFETIISVYLNTKYRISQAVKLKAGTGLNITGTSKKVNMTSGILKPEPNKNFSLNADGSSQIGFTFIPKDNVEIDLCYNSFSAIGKSIYFLELRYFF